MAVRSAFLAGRSTQQRRLSHGVVGSGTMNALAAANPYAVNSRMSGYYLHYVETRTISVRFGVGWAVRIADNLQRVE